MRRFIVTSALLIIVTALSGCAQIALGRAEIDKLYITRIFSIDEAQGGKVKITLSTKSLSTGGGGQQVQQKGENIVAEGETVSEAVRNLMDYSDKKPNFGHTEYILLGEAIARKGVLPYFDFLSRQNDIRNNAKIYIVKGDTAESLVKKTNTSKMFVGDRISRIEEDAHLTSFFSAVTLNEAFLIFDNKNLDTFIPYIEMANTMSSEEKPGIYDVSIPGYAIFREDKLFYFTSKEESRGINWIMNRIGSGIILVKSKLGKETALEIINSKVKIIPRIEGNELHCTVDISFTTNIGEVMGAENITAVESVKYLTEQQEKAIKKEVENTIKAAQKSNSDRFSIVSKFILKYPMMRDYFKKNWKDLFQGVKFEVKVKSNIKGTYLINDPVGSSKKKEGE